MKAVILATTLAAVSLMLWGTYKLLAEFYESIFVELETRDPLQPAPGAAVDDSDAVPFDEREQRIPLLPPNLMAVAGDGDVRLTWSVPSEQLRLVEQWEYEQSDSRGGTAGRYSTGSAGTSYLVAGLTNGETYSFRVQAILKADTGEVVSWSNAVSATPMRKGDVLERLEQHLHEMERHQWGMAQQQEELARHQQTVTLQQEKLAERQDAIMQEQGRIANSASAVVTLVAEDGRASRQLADRGISALESLAASAKGTSGGLTDVGEAPSVVARDVGNVEGGVASELSRIDVVMQELGRRLFRIEEWLLGESLPEPEKTSDICGGQAIRMAKMTFGNNSYNVDYEKNGEEIGRVAKELNAHGKGIVLTVGHTTAIGGDAYNLQLSDQRAACVSLCIRRRLGEQWKSFEFREVAKGETLMLPDLPGTSPDSRRVDVILCQDVNFEGGRAGASSDLLPDSSACGCPPATAGSSGEGD